MTRLLLLCLVASTFASSLSSDWAKFNQFKLKFDKFYAPQDEAERFAVFQSNLERVDGLNALQKRDKVYHYLTKFMDLTPAEFRATVLMNVTAVPKRRVGHVANITARAGELPSDFDWGTKADVVTPVKNQGQCGSCWDFSATETMESVCARAGYKLHKFSEQQIVDCDTNGNDQGCNGGWPDGAYAYVIGAGGIDSESSYPYTAEDGNCAFNPTVESCKITSWEWVTQSEDEGAMQKFVFANSPISICVDASSWQFYNGGVLEASSCTQNIDHCVQVTGWSQQSDQQAWNVRNSWGASWGVNGYIYLQYGQDTCAMAQHVTTPCVVDATTGKMFPPGCPSSPPS